MLSYLLWLGVPGALIILPLIFIKKLDDWRPVMWIIGMIALFFVLVCWPVFWCDQRGKIEQFMATKSLATTTGSHANFEAATFLIEINKANRWLANAQYWAKKPLLAMFWPQEINNLQPIK